MNWNNIPAVAAIRKAAFAFLALAALLLAHTSAVADQGVYYAGGKAYPIDRSETEFVVELEAPAAAARVGDSVTVAGLGTLETIEGMKPNSRFRMLHVDQATPQKRDAAGAIEGVLSVRPVYYIGDEPSPLLTTGRLVARLVAGITDAERDAMFAEYGVRMVEPVAGLADTYLLEPVASPNGDEVEAAAAIYEDERTVYSHPDFRVRHYLRQQAPQDPFFNQQWHLNNTGQENGTPGADIGALEAWETSMGGDIRVGMLDDSCDVDHEDLRVNYLGEGQDIDEEDNDPRPSQIDNRHGTAVMGLMVASANNIGVRGVAPNARFTASRGLGFNTVNQTASAYTFARQQLVDVHCNSWGYGCSFPAPDLVRDAIATSFETGRDGKGMVILFASGNEGLECPEDISSLPTVISVGATNGQDRRSVYSNYGSHLDIMGPSNDDFLAQVVTTDNTDDAGFPEPGYNNGGLSDDGSQNLADPNYTNNFGGTSAACPIVSGVAALVLSVNQELTATQVRVLLEHTAEQVTPTEALYDAITSRSNFYGYGRADAAAAVLAAMQSTTNGNQTWPDRVANVIVSNSTIRWDSGSEANANIVVESDAVFQWTPIDGQKYSVGEVVAPGVTVAFVAEMDSEGVILEQYSFTQPEAGLKYFAIFSQNSFGRYSRGVAVDSDGNVTDAGSIDTGDEPDDGDDGGDVIDLPINEDPKVSIEVSPREGTSPLNVSFQGNALTDSPIATSEWDFGDGSPISTERDVSHTYEVTDGQTHTYVATFTVTDDEGDVGQRSIAITVEASGDAGGGGGSGGTTGGSVRIVVTSPSSGTAEINSGFAPLSVILTLESDDALGMLDSVTWDLGDGTMAETNTVHHTYNTPGRWPVQATVRTCSPILGCLTDTNPAGQTTVTESPVKFIEVLDPGFVVPPQDDTQDEVDDGEGPPALLPTGGDASGGLFCGMSMLPVLLTGVFAFGLRRFRECR